MSGPTWLPPRTLESPERAAPPQMAHSAGSAIYRAPNKKGTSDFRPKYGPYDQNGGGGGGGGGMANRYMATGPTGGPIHHSSSDHYYSPPHGPKEDRNWSPHMDSYELMHRGPEKPASYHSKIDADIDSLTSMLADLDSHPQDSSAQLYDNVPYNKYLSGDHYKPAHQSAGPPQGRPSMGYPPHPQSQYHPAPRYPSEHQAPQYPSEHQAPQYPSEHQAPQYPIEHKAPQYPIEHKAPQYPIEHKAPQYPIEHKAPQYPSEHQAPQYPSEHKAPQYPIEHKAPQYPIEHKAPQYPIEHKAPQYPIEHKAPQYPIEHQAPQYPSEHQAPQYPSEHQAPQYPSEHKAPQYPSEHQAPQYSSEHQAPQYSTSHQPDYYSSSTPKPYPQPVPASYTTSSTPSGPRFTVQVKTAQPVTYSQTGRQAEQAYTPPPPRQHVTRPPPQTSPQGWYPPHPGSQAQEMHSEVLYKGSSSGPGGRVLQVPQSKRGMENHQTGPGAAQTPVYQAGKQAMATTRPEEELDRLTKKLVYDMNHPPVEDYFGRCARCGDNVVGDGSGCIAMEQVFHVECFTCITCHARLRGQPFYALDKKSYCESCYISTLERCSKCSKPILDRILRAMGKAYHPRCFTCVVCNCCLDGVPFTVDATSQIHCIDDFHRKYAPRCSVCGEPIMPEQGQEETVRIVALDRSFHVNCYICEECGLLLSSEGEGRGCYPLDGHILCKSCSACRIQDLSAKISTDC